ncbi:hypothetical protein MTW80_08450 [Mammaliicoccus sciuri]|uniref:hypothetical protein n=1 Tax=Mammaliicoccus sciuri TaxID=1296 RepID=UPI00195C1B36|nr:hypothetical protein [Mammaliicoccus sciuri]MCD8797449.1 hypothetical protein [Mammaliicoccus sciuri]MCD8873617.1 hypothetical protein [Mammaliicoccus sciuri]MCJ0911990.1 hypothetical protein [Mammaliicoccus sciuri]MCJ0952866.1 hypothetical protein [Mammaliicoccus sciuri]QYG32353.1 hypothetical protein K0O13_05765 [Mammaliicoccus sciuri]
MNYRLYYTVLTIIILIQGYFFYYFVFSDGKQNGLQFMGIVSLIFGLILVYALVLLIKHQRRNNQQTFNEHLKKGEQRRLK